jgi:hypothetical protein
MGLQAEGESDEFKRVLIEGNPYLLVSTRKWPSSKYWHVCLVSADIVARRQLT